MLLNKFQHLFRMITSMAKPASLDQKLLLKALADHKRERSLLRQICKISGCDQDDENLPQLATHPYICVSPGAIHVLDSGGAFSQVWSEIEGWDEFVLEHSFE